MQIPWLSERSTQKIKLGSESQHLVLYTKRSEQRFVAKAKIKTVTELSKYTRHAPCEACLDRKTIYTINTSNNQRHKIY